MGLEGIAYISGDHIRIIGLDMPFDRCDLTRDAIYLIDHYSYLFSPDICSIVYKMVGSLDSHCCSVERVELNDSLINRIRKYINNNGVKDKFTGLRFN